MEIIGFLTALKDLSRNTNIEDYFFKLLSKNFFLMSAPTQKATGCLLLMHMILTEGSKSRCERITINSFAILKDIEFKLDSLLNQIVPTPLFFSILSVSKLFIDIY